MSLKKLRWRHYRFIDEYMRNGYNAKQAAIKAGYKEKSATSTAYHLLHDPLISNKIKKLFQTNCITPDQIKAEYTKIALSDKEETPHRLRALDLAAKVEGLLKTNETHTHVTFGNRVEQLAERRQIFDGSGPSSDE